MLITNTMMKITMTWRLSLVFGGMTQTVGAVYRGAESIGGAWSSFLGTGSSSSRATATAPQQQRMENSLREPFLQRRPEINRNASPSAATSSSSTSRPPGAGGFPRAPEHDRTMSMLDVVSARPARPLTATELRRFLLLKFLNFDGNHLPRTECGICRDNELTAETSTSAVIFLHDDGDEEQEADLFRTEEEIDTQESAGKSEPQELQDEVLERGGRRRLEEQVDDDQEQPQNQEQRPPCPPPPVEVPAAPASSGGRRRRRRERRLQTRHLNAHYTTPEAEDVPAPYVCPVVVTQTRIVDDLQPMAFPCGHAACSSCVSQWRAISPENCQRCHLCNEMGRGLAFLREAEGLRASHREALELIRPVSLSQKAIDSLLCLFLRPAQSRGAAATSSTTTTFTPSSGEGEDLHDLRPYPPTLRAALWEAAARHVASMMAENDHQTPAALVLQTDAAAVLERDPELREKLLRRLLAALNSEVRQAYNKRVGRFVTRSFLTYALLQMDLLGLFCIAEACAPAACHVTSSVAGALGCQSCCPTCPCSSCLPSLAQIATALKAPGLAGASGSGLSPSGYSLLCLYCGEIGCFHYKLGTLPVNHFQPPSRSGEGVCTSCVPALFARGGNRVWSRSRDGGSSSPGADSMGTSDDRDSPVESHQRLDESETYVEMLIDEINLEEARRGAHGQSSSSATDPHPDQVQDRGESVIGGRPSSFPASATCSSCCCIFGMIGSSLSNTSTRQSSPDDHDESRQPAARRTSTAAAVFDALFGSCPCERSCVFAPCEEAASCLRSYLRADSWQPYAGGVENFCAPLRCWSLAREMRATTLRVEDLEDFFMSEYEQDEAKGVQPGREQGQGRRGVNTGRGTRAPHRVRTALDAVEANEARRLEQQLRAFRKAWPRGLRPDH